MNNPWDRGVRDALQDSLRIPFIGSHIASNAILFHFPASVARFSAVFHCPTHFHRIFGRFFDDVSAIFWPILGRILGQILGGFLDGFLGGFLADSCGSGRKWSVDSRRPLRWMIATCTRNALAIHLLAMKPHRESSKRIPKENLGGKKTIGERKPPRRILRFSIALQTHFRIFQKIPQESHSSHHGRIPASSPRIHNPDQDPGKNYPWLFSSSNNPHGSWSNALLKVDGDSWKRDVCSSFDESVNSFE